MKLLVSSTGNSDSCLLIPLTTFGITSSLFILWYFVNLYVYIAVVCIFAMFIKVMVINNVKKSLNPGTVLIHLPVNTPFFKCVLYFFPPRNGGGACMGFFSLVVASLISFRTFIVSCSMERG